MRRSGGSETAAKPYGIDPKTVAMTTTINAQRAEGRRGGWGTCLTNCSKLVQCFVAGADNKHLAAGWLVQPVIVPGVLSKERLE